MKRDLVRRSLLVNKYFCFLCDDYHMEFSMQEDTFACGVNRPTYIYSYYNDFGCFSICEIVQRGEWDCYLAGEFTSCIQKLLSDKVRQKDYLSWNVFTARGYLKATARYVKKQILQEGNFFGIEVGVKTD